MSVAAVKPYAFPAQDVRQNFPAPLLYIGWEDHLMVCAPVCLPLPPDMPFGDFIENVVKPSIAPHPDAAKVDFAKVLWRLDDADFQPDLKAGLAANGIGHKSLLRLSTPGLDGLNGSFN